MGRAERIKLYKRICNKYLFKVEDLPHDELTKAIDAGYLVHGFESFNTHNEALVKSKERIAQIDKHEVADAFLYSLSTNLCEYRSPLFSYFYIKSIPMHEFDGTYTLAGKEVQSAFCNVCHYDNNKADLRDSGVSRGFKMANGAIITKYLWGFPIGGSGHYIDPCIMDITQYLEMPKVKSKPQDKEILLAALALIKTLNPSDKAGAYIKALHQSKIIPNSTKDQIINFVDTLGNLNILHRAGDYSIVKGRDKYEASYKEPAERKNDHPFPLTYWRASDGVDWDEVREIFAIK